MCFKNKLISQVLLIGFLSCRLTALGQAPIQSTWEVKRTFDFSVTGDGSAPEWAKAVWLELPQREIKNLQYATNVKILYSDSGIYCLYSCEDHFITATLQEDFADLFNEDVVEAFFWPDDTRPVYFEYELSPLGYELPILVPNFNGKFLGWRPWHYEGNRKTKHASKINKEGNRVSSWTAEFFIPFVLFKPLNNVPPGPGTRWRANFYRIDYDQPGLEWSWQQTRTNFHDYDRFGTIVFQ